MYTFVLSCNTLGIHMYQDQYDKQIVNSHLVLGGAKASLISTYPLLRGPSHSLM